MSVTLYDPEIWLESLVRGIKDFAENGFHESVRDDNGDPVGNNVYDVIMEFPNTDDILKMVPLKKVVVHFEIDEIDDRLLGFGEGIHRQNYSALLKLIQPQEAGEHRVGMDVGVWTSDRSGGVTARLRAYQTLRNLFSGGLAISALREATTNPATQDGGLEILEFTGGRFLQETINDLVIYRMVDCNLRVRCFSRTPIAIEIPTLEEVTIIPELIIDDNLTLPPDNIVANEYGLGTDIAIKTP